MSDRIMVGDEVDVEYVNNSKLLGAGLIVINVPNATGESWAFKDTVKRLIHEVSEGCTITKISDEGL